MMTAIELRSFAYRIARSQPRTLEESALQKICKLGIRIAGNWAKDPIIKYEMNGYSLLMPASHNLPRILSEFPYYESEIGRIACYLSEEDGCLRMIDVGANIGDTIASIPRVKNASFLCIEAFPLYCQLLEKNFADNADVVPVLALIVDDEQAEVGVRIVDALGTGHVEKGSTEDSAILRITLDRLLKEHAPFDEANFLKIDTDGYDLNVLKGASRLLQSSKPCLHVECSPRYWRDYSGNSVNDALQFLSEFDYRDILVYDNHGYLIGRDNTADAKYVSTLADYALYRPGFYMNIVAFNKQRHDLEAFYSSELSNKPGSRL